MRRLAIIAVLWACANAQAQGVQPRTGASAEVAGVYVVGFPLRSAKSLLPEAVYRMPQVDGIYLNLVWSALAPREGAFDWTLFDEEIGRAVKAGKAISIGVRTGRFTPEWVLAGSGHSQFVAGPHNGAAGRCESFLVAWPWDENYQAAYGSLMASIAAHLKTIPRAYESVRIVKITGINEQTQELRLPAGHGNAGTGPGSCRTSDADAAWGAAGYSDEKVLKAWERFAALTAAAFPGKVLGIEVLQSNDFPRIGSAGSAARDLKESIVSEALARWPGRIAVQWDGLSAGRHAEFVVAAARRGAIIGWQTNLFRGFKGAGCDADRFQDARPCTDDSYGAILRNGVEHGARYLEIWPPDAIAFPQAVAEASRALHK
jgi:hypothetical protein